MEKIWRVENKDGQGCYVAHIIDLEKMYNKHDKDIKKHPLPIDDIFIQRYKLEYEICGFIDKEQALKWFTKKELKDLAEFGFDLKEIKVARITAKGQTQILAIRHNYEADCEMSFDLP